MAMINGSFRSIVSANRIRLTWMAVTVALLFAVGFTLLTIAASGSYIMPGGAIFGFSTGILALTLGMRHAFDADHIAAIDNTTRRLIGVGKPAVNVGFFFSLGHSTVVFALATLLGFGIKAVGQAVADDSSTLHQVTGVIGASVSGVFLYVVALLNIIAVVGIVRAFRQFRDGEFDESEFEENLEHRGFLNRVFGPRLAKVNASWQMYPIGVLFGLGFDTATEVALLVLSGTAAVSGLPWWVILALPLLFAAGMCLFDSLDGVLMNAAYGWAFMRPVRKVYYNLVITVLSVFIALVIGSVELLGLFASDFGWSGAFWDAIESVDLNTVGFIVVGLLVATWAIALVIWRVGDFEHRWDVKADRAS